MKDKAALILPAECRYTDKHVWIKAEGGALRLGITDYAQDQLGEVVFVDLPEAGAHFSAGEEFGTVESLKAVNGLFMPVAGEVLEVNAALADTPTLVNVSPYDKGWMLRIRPEDPSAADGLPDAAAYAALLP